MIFPQYSGCDNGVLSQPEHFRLSSSVNDGGQRAGFSSATNLALCLMIEWCKRMNGLVGHSSVSESGVSEIGVPKKMLNQDQHANFLNKA